MHRSLPSIASVVHPDDPRVTIARVELGLTLYLDARGAWPHEGARRVLHSFLAVVPPQLLSWFSTSRTDGWRKVDVTLMAQIAQLLSASWTDRRARHLFEFVLTDDIECPSCGFRYREIDPTRADRAAVIEITLPQEYDAGYLLPIARAAMTAGPLWSGVGGYAVRLGARFQADAFDVAWAWAQRYRGIDIQMPERTAWRAPEGLPGTNWITIVGAGLAAARNVDLALASRHSWIDPFIVSEATPAGLMIVAGEAPTLGDSNRFEEPSALSEVAAMLRPLLLRNAPPFLGRFRESDHAKRWFFRL
jgi:hypothetical protein